ncbi:MAG: hypothetical protein ACJ8EP_09025 [Sphingomicrobium sp.]
MPKERRLESEQDRGERMERHVRARVEAKTAEEEALDAAVRRSIKLHGA